ncbi:capsular polysaccharide export protein [Novosphingobium chloroacetimidivorans]|uniref:Capsular polysaccharide export protein n=1 Tax=Novosphingobium chloroacetimidivorans TaxID=1428314 RepID=A0A7W7NYV4_9SPHN|nr:capsular biosynthesis protein [Novosphingobium chloroacetimidivorans]MBB4860600.1 capsular polysaccharide export protein [Novosphingobium chloroacetimidivorans]
MPDLPASAPHPGPAPGRKSVLLLQGLMGPLFRRLGEELMRAGHTVHKINFNGGDRLFWRLPGGIDYRGSLEDWPAWLEGVIREHQVTDVTLFGDCRDHHMPAIRLCRELGVLVHVFEEGYIRPDWVTLELGGVNGHSSLPRDPVWYRQTAAALPPVPPHAQVPSSFRRRALEGLLYNTADVLTRWYYPHWTNHRPWHPLVEGMGWARKLRRRKDNQKRSEALLDHLQDSAAAYFIFPLQLDSDAQIRLHSPFAGIADALKLVIGSFAAHAPAHTRLVVKEHPLDNGVRDWCQEAGDIAALYGVADRVDYLPAGDIVPVTRRSLGMVTINSTSGTLALVEGVPVVALGHAIYDIPDITFQDGIDAFWSNPVPPDAETFAALRRVLIERCLIPGGFFSDEALDKVVRHAVARFEGHALLPE